MVGDETKCRRKFVKMVQVAYSFQMENKDLIPREMDIIFNAQDNVQSIRLYINGQPEYHKFTGNSQYIPPELSTHGTYNHGLADVWVLGVSLYRMLVGKYPFVASTDRKLFKKMQSADFGIPSSLSEDAKDLLRRMLAPDTTRASLDLVLFHPWLRSYKVTVPSSSVDNNSMPQSPPVVTTTTTTTTTPPASSSTHAATQHGVSEAAVVPEVVQADKKQRHRDEENGLKRVLTGMMLLLVEGPFPPPKRPYQELAHLHTNRPQRALAR
ncbi:kinase-like domain-containing protein [Zychaea mexicana]|uniref:kinase-like domain-containing protein n=1 Tax=Zychaea mexicana TaxID=64656 RepID=UPI0022FF443A|nr:kinase-like domain-containing protein [Zychaea mexicana]KAI9479549.1 kinase-like domain-containing protein [Zychaea mexicana]